MSMKEITGFISKNNIKFRSISSLIGSAFAMCAGLFFALFVDLVVDFKSNAEITLSGWLFLAIIFATGGSIFYFGGDSIKHKIGKVFSIGKLKVRFAPTLFLKFIGILLVIAFIPFLFVFQKKAVYVAIATQEMIATANSVIYVSLALAIVGLVGLIINFVLSAIFLKEDY